MPLNAKPLKIFAVAAVSSLAALSAAQAESDVSFSYKSSELESTAGVSSLHDRMQSRAKSVCAADPRALYARKTVSSCKSQLVEDWVEEIDDTRLDRHHAQSGASQLASVRK
ncbi:UrcA family protein [Hyphococcus sp.]|jgi:UrcA family protein|uniref:UrcA family protein n=1 Tax=Hyphococcus sp. TaxID=2038636 RepID=UPI003D0B6473